MTTQPQVADAAAAPREAQRAILLVAIAAWTMIVPYLGDALGLEVEVAALVEVVDHVVPGAIVVVAGLYLRRLARRGALADQRLALPAAGLVFLAGFWVLATHLPLLKDAAEARVAWEAAIWHSIAALPIVALACWFVLRSIPEQ